MVLVAAGIGGGVLLGSRAQHSNASSPERAAPSAQSAAPASPSPLAAAPAEDTATPNGTASPGSSWVAHADTAQPGYVFFPVDATSDCVRSSGTESDGTPVHYDPTNAIDKLPETAWRCDRDSARLELGLGGSTPLTHVGLIPGYDKTDPHDGTDWFTENLTVTRAVWTFTLNGQVVGTCTEVIDDPEQAMEWAELPATVTADHLTLDITGTGNRDALRLYPRVASLAVSGVGLADDQS
ncbi:hypothetical protein [Streptomyces sp. NBC_00728]|uniref:hypothetical protein n=1 Tax=Streptomyces sp. NBC_00728 TaxID=2903676 RepID=UPI003865229B